MRSDGTEGIQRHLSAGNLVGPIPQLSAIFLDVLCGPPLWPLSSTIAIPIAAC